jgi:hypothetical protein
VIDWAEAAYTEKIRGQKGTPVFKLICPDGTGGSKETIVRNTYSQSKIGETNKAKLVFDKVVVIMKHQGSYNFAETSVKGLETHEKYDVHTHKKDPNYIDPPDRFDPLSKRIFTATVITSAGGTVTPPPVPKTTFQDDVKEDPITPKRK